MDIGYRTFIIKAVTFIGGLYFFLEFILPEEVSGYKFSAYHEQISQGFIAMGAMLVGIGIISLFSVHGTKLLLLRRGWGNSFALIAGLVAMVVLTSLDWSGSWLISHKSNQLRNLSLFAERIEADFRSNNDQVLPVSDRADLLIKSLNSEILTAEQEIEGIIQNSGSSITIDEKSIESLRELSLKLQATVSQREPVLISQELLQAVPVINEAAGKYLHIMQQDFEHSLAKRLLNLLLNGLFTALGAATFSLLGFYIVSAAYRAFRIKSVEAALMMLAAVIVMLGQISFGSVISEHLPELRLWLLQVPNTAASRAIFFGSAVAGVILAIRMWFSIESQSFSSRGGAE